MGGGGACPLASVHRVVKGRWFHHLLAPKCQNARAAAGPMHGLTDLGACLDCTHRYEPKTARWKQYTTKTAIRQARKATSLKGDEPFALWSFSGVAWAPRQGEKATSAPGGVRGGVCPAGDILDGGLRTKQLARDDLYGLSYVRLPHRLWHGWLVQPWRNACGATHGWASQPCHIPQSGAGARN